MLQGRSYTPFEYDADTAVNNLNVGGMAIADEGEAAVPANAVNANPPTEDDLLQAEIRANLDFINSICLDDSSNQNFPMVIDSLKSVKIIAASAGHRHW